MQVNQSSIQLPGIPLALGSAILFGAAAPLSTVGTRTDLLSGQDSGCFRALLSELHRPRDLPQFHGEGRAPRRQEPRRRNNQRHAPQVGGGTQTGGSDRCPDLAV